MFVDSKFVDTSRGVTFVMNPPYQAHEPVLMPDQAWEQRTGASYGIYSSILKDVDGRIRAWYHVRIGDYRSGRDEAHVAYAESADGIHFTKPVLNLFESGGTTANNIVIPGDIGGSSVWIDPHADPDSRYRNQAKVYSPPEVWGHLHMHGSPDGIHWKLSRDIRLQPRRVGYANRRVLGSGSWALRHVYPALVCQAARHSRGQHKLPYCAPAGVRRLA